MAHEMIIEVKKNQTRKIGDRFELNATTLMVVAHNDCKGCFFYKNGCRNKNNAYVGECCKVLREDNKKVIFLELTRNK